MKNTVMSSLEKPVTQNSVVSRIIQRIKDALINKELKPGDYLPTEAELMKNLGVSKTSLREAIKMLQALGVVDVKRGHGTRIREHPADSMIDPLIFQLILEDRNPKDLIELRMMFEPAFTLMAMKKANQGDIEKIQAALERFESEEPGEASATERDLAFHLAILESSHNPLVSRIGETVYRLFNASIEKALRTDYQLAKQYHRRIFSAFCQKNQQELLDALHKSFSQWGHTIEEALDDEKGGEVRER
jgi:GntR family transcriptional repressor for pyruvate dehydrogenase complex